MNNDQIESQLQEHPPQVSASARTRGIFFFLLFSLIITIQCCYWLFANSAEPIVLGMPYGMFFVVLFIAIEFVALIALYILEGKDAEGGEQP